MQRWTRTVSCAMFALPVLSFALWWNYASLAMSYPTYKSQLRHWSWRTFGDPFDRESRRIAGFRAVNCVVPEKVAGKANQIGACISTARLDHRGFRTRFNVCGVDACGAVGLVGSPDGSVYQLSFHLYQGRVSLKRRQCPYPLALGTAERQFYLYCLPEPQPGEFEILRHD